MRQSKNLIILQLFGISLGLFTVFKVASGIPSKLYAITGVYAVISSIVTVFSNTGLETYAMRNVLAWKEEGKIQLIKTSISRAILLRTLIALMLFLPVLAYSWYLSTYKFNGDLFGLFALMGIMSLFAALNDSMVLILKSFNKYFSAALILFSIEVFGKLAALVLFIKYGFSAYIHTIIFLPLIVTIPVLFILKKWLTAKNIFSFNGIIADLRTSRHFRLSSYISYIFNYFDQFAVSIFLTPGLLGSYTLGKSLLGIARRFISNVFDPSIQKLVSYKNDLSEFKLALNKIFKVRDIILVLGIIGIPIFYLYFNDFIKWSGLSHYPNLFYYGFLIYLSQIVFIMMKVKHHVVIMFYDPKYYFMLMVITSTTALVLFFINLVLSVKLLFAYSVVTYFIMTIITLYIYNKHKENPLESSQ